MRSNFQSLPEWIQRALFFCVIGVILVGMFFLIIGIFHIVLIGIFLGLIFFAFNWLYKLIKPKSKIKKTDSKSIGNLYEHDTEK
jgi:uncharacterized membrane protein